MPRQNLQRNPGEFLHIGDQMVLQTDLNVFVFGLPGSVGHGEYQAFIDLQAGDVVEYLGVDYRAERAGILAPIQLHRFKLIRMDDDGEFTDTIFYMKNVETLLKWSKMVEHTGF